MRTRNYLRWMGGRAGRRARQERERAQAAREAQQAAQAWYPAQQPPTPIPDPYWGRATFPAWQNTQYGAGGTVTISNNTFFSNVNAWPTAPPAPPDPWAAFEETADPEADLPAPRNQYWMGSGLYCGWVDEGGKELLIGPGVPDPREGFQGIRFKGIPVGMDPQAPPNTFYYNVTGGGGGIQTMNWVEVPADNPRHLGVINGITEP